MSRPLAWFLIVLVVTGSASCAKKDVRAATVDGQPIEASDVEHILDAVAANDRYVTWHKQKTGTDVLDASGKPTPRYIADVIANEITVIVTARLARSRHIRATARDRAQGRIDASTAVGSREALALFPDDLERLFVARAARDAAFRRTLIAGVTPEEYYRKHADDFTKACSRDIVVTTVEQALAAKARIDGGVPFASVAKDVSMDKGTGPKGGDLRCNGMGDLIEGLDRRSFTQPVGLVSDPIVTERGVHLLLVYRRSVPSLSQIHGEVVGAVDRLGADRLGALLRRALVAVDVTMDVHYGHWDPIRLDVVPAS